MRARYDRTTDTLLVVLREDARIAESDEQRPGVILDFDAEGNLVSIEVMDASRRVTDAERFDFETAE